MALGIFQNINIDKTFRQEVMKLSNDGFINWIKLVFIPYNFSKYNLLKDEIIESLDIKQLEKINQYLKEEKKFERYFLSALKNLLLSLENRMKIFDAMDDLTKYVYKHTKSYDQMITERLRQYKLLSSLSS